MPTESYRIAGNFRRTLFSEISETSGIFRKFFTKWYFQAFSKEGKDNRKFRNIFPKYSLKRIFRKFQ